MARANNLKNSGVPDDIFQLDDLSVLVCGDWLFLSFQCFIVYLSPGMMGYACQLSAMLLALFNFVYAGLCYLCVLIMCC